MTGDQATVDLRWSGLPQTFMDAPYPHVQHIHIGARGQCPFPSADGNGDGIVDTVEGQSSYGSIGTTLSVKGDTSAKAGTNIKIAPGGGTGVIVIHGLDPAPLSKKAANAKSNLVPSFPSRQPHPRCVGHCPGCRMEAPIPAAVTPPASRTSAFSLRAVGSSPLRR